MTLDAFIKYLTLIILFIVTLIGLYKFLGGLGII